MHCAAHLTVKNSKRYILHITMRRQQISIFLPITVNSAIIQNDLGPQHSIQSYSPASVSWTSLTVSELILLLLLNVMLHFDAENFTSDERSQLRYWWSRANPCLLYLQTRRVSKHSVGEIHVHVTVEPTVTAVSRSPLDAAQSVCKPTVQKLFAN